MTTTTQITEQDVLTLINDMEELRHYNEEFLDEDYIGSVNTISGDEIITHRLKDSHYKTLRKMIDFINHKKNNMINKLIKNHDIIVNELKEENNKLKAEAAEYMEANQFYEFIEDKLQYDPNSSEGLSVHRIYDVYKQWYSANYVKCADNKFKSRRDLSIYLDDRYGKYYSPGVTSKEKGYKGLTILFGGDNNSGSFCPSDDEDELGK